ncbi:MAG TPA: HEAT repeat domain-containing protein [Pirellulales bacterium]|nr:HEAT repeat domain-containing protein [Pirellulales bacterium]
MKRILFVATWMLASAAAAIAVEPQPAPSSKHDKPSAESPLAEKSSSDAAAADAGLTWIDGLTAGLHAAQRDNRTLLVVAGSVDCPWCEKLAIEFHKPLVVGKLKSRGLVLVHVDIDAEPAAVRSLAVGPIPALRLMSPRGSISASHDGFLSAEELVRWLDDNLVRFASAPPAILTETQPPDPNEVSALIDEFKQPDPLVREAASRRLAPYPKLAVASVSAALEKGNLATRLSALELLGQWHAPLAGLDPWHPESFSESRRKALDAWSMTVRAAGKSAAAPPPTQAEIDAAAAEMGRLADLPERDAEALCERLARFRAALLPRAIAAWKDATSDRAKQRLLTLRYRLVASDLVMLTWPGGLARLASSDPTIRHKAAEELVERATPDDQPLLLELFKDPDPLVREISLRGLQHVSPGETGGALAALLDDPDPNVRAAVLKQLAEDPSADMAAKVAAYAAREKDPDLLVHALRYLKGMPRPESVKAAMGLLKSPNWQVRAEAVDALSRLSTDDSLQASLRADASAALSDLMDDPEPFVISRVFHGLIDNRIDVPAERLVKAAHKHPELMADVVSLLLGRWHSTSPKDIDVLRTFFKQPDALIRASILSGLRGPNAEAFSSEIIDSLSDKSPTVRAAAARLLFKAAGSVLENARSNRAAQRSGGEAAAAPPQEAPSVLAQLLSALGSPKTAKDKIKPTAPAVPPDPSQEWLAGFRKCSGVNAWMREAPGPLTKMLDGTSGERLAAATALVALGEHADRTLPLLKQMVRGDPEAIETVAEILPWLSWEQRQDWFDLLVSSDAGHDDLRTIVQELVIWPDSRAAPLLWKQLALYNDAPQSAAGSPRHRARRSTADSHIDAIYYALRSLYPRESPDPDSAAFDEALPFGAATAMQRLAELKQRAEHGSSAAERVVALAILCDQGAPQTAAVAATVEADPKSSAELREIGLKALLLAGAADVAVPAAIEGLKSADEGIKRIAVRYLAQGPAALSDFGYGIFIYKSSLASFRGSEQELAPQPPKNLTADAVRPLLKDDDPDVSAGAAYLLALMGSPDGLDVLVRRWRSADADDTEWLMRVATAVSALDDPAKVPLLEEIYKKLSAMRNESSAIRQFYWTIRSMHGAEVLKLRKKIRDEVGMDSLR